MDLPQLSRALQLFAHLDHGSLPLHHVQLFVLVAKAGKATYREIEEALGLSNAAVSRSVNALASNVRHRQSSLGLLEIHHDPAEGRRYMVRLSPKGRSLARTLEDMP